MTAETDKRVADIVAGQRIGRRERRCALCIGEIVRVTVQLAEAFGAHLQRRQVVRLLREADGKRLDGLRVALLLVQQQSALERGLLVSGINRERMLVTQQCFGAAIERQEHAAEMLPQFGIIRFELNGLVEHRQRIVEPAHLLEREAEAGQIVDLWRLPDGLRKPSHGVIVLPRLQRDQAHQIEAVGVAGIELERLLAAQLGIEQLACAEVMQSGLVQRGRRKGGHAIRAARHALAALLPVAAAHRMFLFERDKFISDSRDIEKGPEDRARAGRGGAGLDACDRLTSASTRKQTLQGSTARPDGATGRERHMQQPNISERLDLAAMVADLNALLRLKTTVIGIKMFARVEDMAAVEKIRRPNAVHTTDQIVSMAARLGWTVGITADDLVGAQCRAVIGLGPQDDTWLKGENYVGVWHGTAEDARKRQEALDVVPFGRYQAMAVSPLSSGRLDPPDICLVYATPGQMIILINGLQYVGYKKFEWGVVGETACADSWGRALKTGEPSLSLPCFAERRYGGVPDEEMLMALKPADLAKAIAGMKQLAKNGLRYPIAPYGIQNDVRAGMSVSYGKK